MVEYPQWPVRSGYDVVINGKTHKVISAPAVDPLEKMPEVLYKGKQMSDPQEPIILVEECPVIAK
jgi:hypothetical protein